MDEGALGFLIFIAISISFSLVAHWRMKAFWAASILSAVFVVIIFQVLSYIQLGYLDPFLPIAIVVSGLIAIAISIAIGGIFKYKRHKPVDG
jgi:phosphatidylserine synthase